MGNVAKGKVSLVGAGPGDPELITLKAVKVLTSADVVLVDELVNPHVLTHVPDQALVVPVGKRGGHLSTDQAWILNTMLTHAQQGKHVVRLKGGDPYIFARGGEEQWFLQEQGVEVDIVAGITSGLAAAGVAQVPLTHRDHAHGVIFVTGHGRADGVQNQGPKNMDFVDWALLAKSQMTLVIYMGMRRCAAIQAALLDGGLSSDTPVAVVQSATCPEQKWVRTTLGQLSEMIKAQSLGSPGVMIVG